MAIDGIIRVYRAYCHGSDSWYFMVFLRMNTNILINTYESA